MLNVKKLLNKMLTTEVVKRKGYIIPSRSWAAGATWLSSLNLKPVADEGYEIIGLLGYTANNNSVLFTNMYYDVANKRLNGFVRNTSSSAITDYIYVELLERKLGGYSIE